MCPSMDEFKKKRTKEILLTRRRKKTNREEQQMPFKSLEYCVYLSSVIRH